MKVERESGRGESIPDGHGGSCQGQSIWGSVVVLSVLGIWEWRPWEVLVQGVRSQIRRAGCEAV